MLMECWRLICADAASSISNYVALVVKTVVTILPQGTQQQSDACAQRGLLHMFQRPVLAEFSESQNTLKPARLVMLQRLLFILP